MYTPLQFPGPVAPTPAMPLPDATGYLDNLYQYATTSIPTVGADSGTDWLEMLSDKNGLGGMALGGAQLLSSMYFGNKQLGLAEDQLKESKRQFDLNWGAQKKLTNARMEDRQRARVASNPNAYRSVSEYMDQNRI